MKISLDIVEVPATDLVNAMGAEQYRRPATKIGITPEAYAEHVARGEKWCWRCKEWHLLAAFGSNKRMPDGIASRCRKSEAAERRSRQTRNYDRRVRELKQALHEVYDLVQARVPQDEILDKIREAAGRP